MSLPLLGSLPALVLGLVFGSFLNVVIARVPQHESVVTPRSRCPHCGHVIRWYDNIPLLSYVLLRGRCRDCRHPISWRYPAVELATGLWLAAVALLAVRASMVGLHAQLGLEQYLALSVTTLALATFGLFLIPLFVIDWQHHRLPDAVTLPGILTGFLLTCAQAVFLPTGANDLHFDPRRNLRLRSPGSFIARGDVFLTGTERLIFGRVAAILAAALLLLFIRWLYKAVRHREGLGLGDVKLCAMLAAFLGLTPALLALFLGVLLATAFALTLLARRRAHALTELPLGSFLCVGGLLAALFGEPILAWYKSLL